MKLAEVKGEVLIAKAMTMIMVFLRRGPSSLTYVIISIHFLMCRFVAFSEFFRVLFLFGLTIDLPSLKLTARP